MSVVLYNNCKIVFRNCRRFNFHTLCLDGTRAVTKCQISRWKYRKSQTNVIVRRGVFGSPQQEHEIKYTPLMKYPEAVWPGIFQMSKCWFNLKLVMPMLEPDFDIPAFIEGTQHAVHVASTALSKNDFETLSDLVTPEAVEILKENILHFSPEQQRGIAVKKEEFFFCFPWNVSIRQKKGNHSKVAEIVVVFHILRDWKNPLDPQRINQLESGMERLELMHSIVSDSEFPNHAIVCNYRFIREFDDKHSNKPWLINLINHFRLSDVFP